MKAKTKPSARSGRPSALSELSASNLVLVGLFLAGIAGVYFLSLRGGPAKASADQQATEQKVETALLAMQSAPAKAEVGGVALDREHYDMRRRQIPAADLRGNPFVFVRPLAEAPAVTEGPAEPTEPTIREATPGEMQGVAERLRLQSVLMGRQGATAVISRNLLTEGQMIQGWLVHEVRAREVELRWKNLSHVLRMEE